MFILFLLMVLSLALFVYVAYMYRRLVDIHALALMVLATYIMLLAFTATLLTIVGLVVTIPRHYMESISFFVPIILSLNIGSIMVLAGSAKRKDSG